MGHNFYGAMMLVFTVKYSSVDLSYCSQYRMIYCTVDLHTERHVGHRDSVAPKGKGGSLNAATTTSSVFFPWTTAPCPLHLDTHKYPSE